MKNRVFEEKKKGKFLIIIVNSPVFIQEEACMHEDIWEMEPDDNESCIPEQGTRKRSHRTEMIKNITDPLSMIYAVEGVAMQNTQQMWEKSNKICRKIKSC